MSRAKNEPISEHVNAAYAFCVDQSTFSTALVRDAHHRRYFVPLHTEARRRSCLIVRRTHAECTSLSFGCGLVRVIRLRDSTDCGTAM